MVLLMIIALLPLTVVLPAEEPFDNDFEKAVAVLAVKASEEEEQQQEETG